MDVTRNKEDIAIEYNNFGLFIANSARENDAVLESERDSEKVSTGHDDNVV